MVDETESEKKTLIVYFSWSGNTKDMASYISEQTGGDVFEIQPAVAYPENYQETGDIAKEERDNNARPEILNLPEDIGLFVEATDTDGIQSYLSANGF